MNSPLPLPLNSEQKTQEKRQMQEKKVGGVQKEGKGGKKERGKQKTLDSERLAKL